MNQDFTVNSFNTVSNSSLMFQPYFWVILVSYTPLYINLLNCLSCILRAHNSLDLKYCMSNHMTWHKQCIHSSIYLHSPDPYMVSGQDAELINNKKVMTSHINYIYTLHIIMRGMMIYITHVFKCV